MAYARPGRAARRHGPTLAALALLALPACPAAAVDVESLVMPGPLARAHAKLERDCGHCHQPFRRQSQDALCLACHDDVALDRRAKTGFHGRAPGAATAACRECHPDHRGRDADIVGFTAETFSHEHTDFQLEGAHARLRCEACHAAGKRFREAPGACADCHASDDAHRGGLGKDCGRCHQVSAWKDLKGHGFDHAKTGFRLVGAHARTDCALCHPKARYKDTPTDCRSCHALDDVHHGTLGPRCQSCHTARSWKQALFDHGRETRFALEGAHASLACARCHRGPPAKEKLDTRCVACHRSDDDHHGQNGDDCGRCHGSAAWKPARFRHDRDTKFPLRGAHASAPCQACHRGDPFARATPTDCLACHRKDDVHRGQQGSDCGRCHRESGWTDGVAFDHGLTRFPLLGLHAAVGCEQCHPTAAYRDVEKTCVGCHATDDVHKGGLGADCAACHNPNGWERWQFDHAARTDFPLREAHADLACNACHVQPASEVRLSRQCGICHARDDVHRGAFGRSCERCHGEADWKPRILPP